MRSVTGLDLKMTLLPSRCFAVEQVVCAVQVKNVLKTASCVYSYADVAVVKPIGCEIWRRVLRYASSLKVVDLYAH